MRRNIWLFLIAIVVPIAAVAQDTRGAGRTEITSALFGGGLLITP